MNKGNYLYFFLIFCTLVFFTGACTMGTKNIDYLPPQQPQKAKISVAAAADLMLAFKEIGQIFETNTGVQVDFSFSSTGVLAQQIENGAPFDVFAAANVKFVDDLKAKGMIIPDTQCLYAQGRIGFATASKYPVKVDNFQDLLRPEIKKIAIANPEHAPYGMVAKQAMEKAGVWEKVQDKLTYGKNIQDTWVLVQTGNADVGIIALSLVKKEEMEFTLIDQSMHKPLAQSMAVITTTKNESAARKFVEYVNSTDCRAIMKKYGFIR